MRNETTSSIFIHLFKAIRCLFLDVGLWIVTMNERAKIISMFFHKKNYIFVLFFLSLSSLLKIKL